MSKSNGITVTGGKMQYPRMTNKLAQKDYEEKKLASWLNMLNEGMRPEKWLKPTKNGTGVHFKGVHSQEEYDEGIKELRTFMNELNEKNGTDYRLMDKGEEEENDEQTKNDTK